jgi:cell division protein FtsA
MATTPFIAAIELTSSRIAGIAGKTNPDGSLYIQAYATEDASSCVRKGIVFNIDETAQALTAIINKLETQLEQSIAKVYVGIGGLSTHTCLNKIEREVNNEEIITPALVDAICDENLASKPEDMDILDVAPQEYIIDNTPQVRAVGVAGQHIMAQYLNIVARTALKKNLEHSFEKAQIEIADLLIAPTALAQVVLTEAEMRSGCALVDFGADTTTVSVYKNSLLRYLAVIPLGGNNITRDLTTLQMEDGEAERLKLSLGDMRYEEENTDVPNTFMTEDGRSIELFQLNKIIYARQSEIIANILHQIQLSEYDDRLLSGVVLTGGGANMKHLEDIFRQQSKITKVRTARFVQPVIETAGSFLLKDGTQNTLIGLLAMGKENCANPEEKKPEEVPPLPELPPIAKSLFDQDEAIIEADEQRKAAAEAAQKQKKQEKTKKQRSWFSGLTEKFEKATNSLFSDSEMSGDDKE